MADKQYKLNFAMSDGSTKSVQFTAPQGPKGDKGDTGPQGPKGDTGPQGPAGESNIAYALKVVVSGADGVYTVDKTLAEIAEAWVTNRPLYCVCTYSEGGFFGENVILAPIMVTLEQAMFGAYSGDAFLAAVVVDGGAAVVFMDIPTMEDIPTKLPNPQPLTFTGEVTGTYDGSAAKAVNIPKAVRYESQTLTDSQKSQARSNIGLDSNITFDTFPSEDVVNAMANWTVFKTRGFYSKDDGVSGTYTVKSTSGSLWVPYGSKYFIPYKNSTLVDRDIYVDMYGVRRGDASYAERNSEILTSLMSVMQNGYTLHFGSGHYYFADPIICDNKYITIKGVSTNACVPGTDVNIGTYLHFPNLADGEAAIIFAGGAVQDLGIDGNPNICNVSLDRTQTLTNPSGVVTLVDTGTTYGIKPGTRGYTIQNVGVKNFTYGIYSETGNFLIDGVTARQCKIGISVGNDVKITNVQLWNVMTGIELRGQLASATNIRGDSIGKHLIECKNGKCLLSNIDGDYCVGSLIHYGGGNKFIHLGQATACLGRVAIRNAYSRSGTFDLRTLSDADYEYCSYISIAPNTQVFGGHIDLVNVSANPMDSSSGYVHPNASISIGTGSTVKGVTIKCNIPYDADAEYFNRCIIKNLSTYAEASNDTTNYQTDFDGKTVEDVVFITPVGFVRSMRTVSALNRVLEFDSVVKAKVSDVTTSMPVMVRTTNLNDGVYEYGRFAAAGTEYNDNPNNQAFRSVNYIPVEGGRTIAAYYDAHEWNDNDKGLPVQVVQYDSDKNILVARTDMNPYVYNNSSLALNANTAYIRFCIARYKTISAPLEDIKIAIYYIEDIVKSFIEYEVEKDKYFVSGERVVLTSPEGDKYVLGIASDGSLKAGENVIGPAKGETIHYIEGTGTTAGTWLGTCEDITEYYDGLTIAYKIAIAGASTTTLNINGLGAKTVRRATANLTTHLNVNTVVHMTYTTIDGVGYWVWANYDSGNTKVTQSQSSTATGKYPVLLSYYTQDKTTTTAQTVRRDNNFYYQASTGTLTVKEVAGNAATATKVKNALTLTGEVSGTYDGSAAKTFNIPKSYRAATPQDYGVTGGDNDFAAFRDALANNRRVFVPGGNYNIDGELVIRDNCELELAQDAVLYFKQTSGNCISMKQCASIKGNHASVSVPYTFSGNVINVDTGLTTAVNECPPFAKWDPMWKNARYLTDLNILKPDTRGFYYSMDCTCNGTAVYLSADGLDVTTWLWAVNFSGLRIAGAFTYGIHAENFNFDAGNDGGWNHEMRIEGFIDGAEVGVRLDNCHNAYLSTIVQPRRAYTTSGEYIPYAKWGICLNNSRNCDMSGSRVWDWDSQKSLWTNGGINQHLALLGDCRGLITNEYYYISNSSYDIRELIYTDTPSNFDHMIIIQEPFTRWFKPVDHEPYFFDGDRNNRLVLQEELDDIVDGERVPTFTNILPQAADVDGSIFNGIGYCSYGYELQNDGSVTDDGIYCGCTGFIPVKQNDVIYAKNISLTGAEVAVVTYDSSKAKIQHAGPDNLAGMTYFFDYVPLDDGFKLTIKQRATTAFIRFGYGRTSIGKRPIISINEPIEYVVNGYLTDGIKVKSTNIEGLSEILGSYIDDVDALIGG